MGFQVMDYTPEEIIELCRYSNIGSIEFNESFLEFSKKEELEEKRELFKESPIKTDSVHLPFGPEDDITSFYEKDRRAAVRRMEWLLEKAAILGVRAVILHPSVTDYTVEDEGLNRFVYYMGESLEVLLPRAERLGLTIAVENMFSKPGGNRFGSLPEHFRILASKFAHPNFGFCLDTGHAQITGGSDGPAAFFDAMGSRIKAFHLHDNAGDRDSHLAPGRGLVDWDVVFSNMADLGYSYPACIEAPPFSYGPGGTYSREAWKNMIDHTEKMAKRVSGDLQ